MKFIKSAILFVVSFMFVDSVFAAVGPLIRPPDCQWTRPDPIAPAGPTNPDSCVDMNCGATDVNGNPLPCTSACVGKTFNSVRVYNGLCRACLGSFLGGPPNTEYSYDMNTDRCTQTQLVRLTKGCGSQEIIVTRIDNPSETSQANGDLRCDVTSSGNETTCCMANAARNDCVEPTCVDTTMVTNIISECQFESDDGCVCGACAQGTSKTNTTGTYVDYPFLPGGSTEVRNGVTYTQCENRGS